MARQIIVLGMAKSGTLHIATLYRKLFEANGINGIAQHQKGFGLISPDVNFIDCDWSKSPKIGKIAKDYPYARFIILYRRVLESCASLHNYYLGKGSPDKDLTPEQLVDKYWKRTYESIYEKLPDINPKPWFIWSKDYFDGYYNQIMLDLFDLPVNDQNMKLVEQHRHVPVNRSKGKDIIYLNADICNECDQIGENIRKACIPPWVEGEIYG